MHLEVSFRNLKPREEVRVRAQTLFRKLHRFLDPAAEGQLVVAIEHGHAILEAVVNTRGTTIKATEEDEELRTALDRVFHTLEAQLRKGKERRMERRHEEGGEEASEEDLAADVADEVAEEEVLEEMEAAPQA